MPIDTRAIDAKIDKKAGTGDFAFWKQAGEVEDEELIADAIAWFNERPEHKQALLDARDFTVWHFSKAGTFLSFRYGLVHHPSEDFRVRGATIHDYLNSMISEVRNRLSTTQ